MTVQAYTDRFDYLARIYSLVVTEEWKSRKFEGGRKHELHRFLVPLKIREFPILVEQAKTNELLEMGPNRVAQPQKATLDSWQQKKPYNRPQSSTRKL